MILKSWCAVVSLSIMAAASVSCASSPSARYSARDLREAEEHARQMVAMENAIPADTSSPMTIGVTPLRVGSGDPALEPLGFGLADFIMADLAVSSQLTVVNRLRFDAILRELDLVGAGRVDSSSAPRVGKLIGAGRLITGSIASQPNSNLSIGSQVVRTSTGETRVVVAGTANLDQILRAQKDLTLRIFQQLGVTLTPAERARIEQFQTESVAAFIAYSRGVQYEAEGRFAAAAREFKRAAQIDPQFALASQRAVTTLSLSAWVPLSRAIASTNYRVNRPLVQPNAVEQRGATDPSFPSSGVTLRIVISVPQ